MTAATQLTRSTAPTESNFLMSVGGEGAQGREDYHEARDAHGECSRRIPSARRSTGRCAPDERPRATDAEDPESPPIPSRGSWGGDNGRDAIPTGKKRRCRVPGLRGDDELGESG